jgi:hypothetical protein
LLYVLENLHQLLVFSRGVAQYAVPDVKPASTGPGFFALQVAMLLVRQVWLLLRELACDVTAGQVDEVELHSKILILFPFLGERLSIPSLCQSDMH